MNATHSAYTSAGALSVRASQTKGDNPIKSGNNYSDGYYIAASNSNSYDNDITMEAHDLPKLATPESPTAAEFETSASVMLTCATNGTTKYLKFLDGARFKPDGVHYLTVTEKLVGTMKIDLSDIDMTTAKWRVPLFKVGSSEMLPAEEALQFVGGIPRGWQLEALEEGYGYDLVHRSFTIIVR